MAAQGGREPGVVDMDGGLLDPMAQDEEVEQEMLVVEEEEQFFPPQMDPEPEMGAAAAEAVVYDTSPPHPHQNPPIPAETAQPSALDIILQALSGMENRMNENMEDKMNTNTNKLSPCAPGSPFSRASGLFSDRASSLPAARLSRWQLQHGPAVAARATVHF